MTQRLERAAAPLPDLRDFSLWTDDGVLLRGVVRDVHGDSATYDQATSIPTAAGSTGRPAPVALVNGLTMSVAAWDGLERLLATERTVVRYDMRGQGASDAPEGPYPPSRHAADLEQVLTALRLPRVHLVALSNGGLVAQRVAASLAAGNSKGAGAATGARPAAAAGTAAGPGIHLVSLALLDSFATVDAHLRAVLRSWLQALRDGGPEARFDAALPWVWGPDFLEANATAIADARSSAAAASDHAVRGLIEGLLADETREPTPGLANVDTPLLVAVGEHDVLTPPRAGAAITAAFGRGDVTVVPGVGHAGPIENPSAIARLLLPFLTAADSEAA
ncbi:MAG: alpha/beta hydrolase [Trueperaceae bacterium]